MAELFHDTTSHDTELSAFADVNIALSYCTRISQPEQAHFAFLPALIFLAWAGRGQGMGGLGGVGYGRFHGSTRARINDTTPQHTSRSISIELQSRRIAVAAAAADVRHRKPTAGLFVANNM